MVEPISETSEPLAERRRLPRLRTSIAVQFRNVLKPQESYSGSLSKDLSASGVRLITPHFLPKEARLVLLLFMPRDLKPLRIIARVVWMRRKPFNEAYECGIQFLEIDPEDRGAIAEFVERGTVVS